MVEGAVLRSFGWDDDVAAAAAGAAGTEPSQPGRVARVDRGIATVLLETGPVRAAFESDVATGDWVLVRSAEDADGPDLAVAAVLPRRSAFVRGDPREGVAIDAQVVAANIDTVFVVQSLSNGPNIRRLERELVLAWQSGAEPVVVLTKRDLAESDDAVAHAVASIARIAPDLRVIVTSAVAGTGIDELRAFATEGRTVALVGASGVGKSTLVNQLAGSDVQATSEVRAGDQRGRHTTTARELVLLPTGGVLVDTPGLRAVSLWEADEGMERAFADIEALANHCRFRDCRHEQEPDCAVQAASDAGTLDPLRLASYLRLQDELDRQAVMAEEASRRERPRRRR
jgi:ribosome biogenesis GTPase / thiamine phosphate phosphatase